MAIPHLLKERKEILKKNNIRVFLDEFELTRYKLAQIIGTSERNIHRWIQDTDIRPQYNFIRRLKKLEELKYWLKKVIKEEDIGKWLNTPNSGLGDRTPIKEISSMENPEDGMQTIINLLKDIQDGTFT